jgi:hypothetical protein
MSDTNPSPGSDHDAEWNRQQRDETPTERFDRNWGDLIQELRVLQTGVQFLTGFLLTLPFQQKFSDLDDAQIALYLSTVAASICATAFLQAPVSVHRALFRRHQRGQTVQLAHRLSIVGMILLGGAVIGVATLIFDVVVSATAGAIAGVITAALLIVLWLAVPVASRG